jgi:carnitine 3-dehydrogenase
MKNINSVAVIGCGVIGMSWTSLFLAREVDVTVVDPRPDAEEELNAFIRCAWPNLRAIGLCENDSVPRASFTQNIANLPAVEFVQECGPDRLDIKHQLIADIEKLLDPDVVIASSTSSIKASDIQRHAQHPERILVGHPMNPPHLIPMVEIVAGEQTAEEFVDTAESFYRQMRRVPIRVQKEVVGHLANRLTSALYREAVHIVAEGIASVEDVDKAITNGPGMRWAFIGPHLTYHLGGGKGGYRHYLDHLGPTQEARWVALGSSALNGNVKDELVAGIEKELELQDADTLSSRRDKALVELLALKSKFGF